MATCHDALRQGTDGHCLASFCVCVCVSCCVTRHGNERQLQFGGKLLPSSSLLPPTFFLFLFCIECRWLAGRGLKQHRLGLAFWSPGRFSQGYATLACCSLCSQKRAGLEGNHPRASRHRSLRNRTFPLHCFVFPDRAYPSQRRKHIVSTPPMGVHVKPFDFEDPMREKSGGGPKSGQQQAHPC